MKTLFGISVLSVGLLFGGYFFSVSFFLPDLAARAQFGDMFGGLNALFSGLAFACLTYTLVLQREELSLQRKELSLTRQELARTAGAQEGSQKALRDQAEHLKQSSEKTFTPYLVLGHGSDGDLFLKNLGNGIAKDIVFREANTTISGRTIANISSLGSSEEKAVLSSTDGENYWRVSKREFSEDVALNYRDLLNNPYSALFRKSPQFREYVVVEQVRHRVS